MARSSTRLGWFQVIAVGTIVLCLGSQARVQTMPKREFAPGAPKAEIVNRGTMISADGEVIAESIRAYELRIDYRRVPQSPGFWAELSAATGLSFAELMDSPQGPIPVRTWQTGLSQADFGAIRRLAKEWRADGLSLEPFAERVLPLKSIQPLLGRVNERGVGVSGIERGLDDLIREAQTEKGGPEIGLTVDTVIQESAQRALEATMTEFKADAGTVVVLNPANGDVLALASAPLTTKNKEGEIVPVDRNVAAYDLLEPGSTFKILTLAEALDLGVVSRGYHGHCTGTTVVAGRTIRCAGHAHGDVDIYSAIAKSCNKAATDWGMQIGHENFRKMLMDLRLTKPTQTYLAQQRERPLTDDPAKRLQLATWSFGQSMNFTPLRLASAFGTLANGGILVEPRILRSVNGKDVQPTVVGEIFKAETCETVMRAMEAVFESEAGTAHNLRIPGVKLAGKTGTAERRKGGASETKGYIASFIGYVPTPKGHMVVLVMVDRPKGERFYGGQVAAPVFREVAQTILQRAQSRAVGSGQ